MQIHFREKEWVQHSTLTQKAEFFQNISFSRGTEFRSRKGLEGQEDERLVRIAQFYFGTFQKHFVSAYCQT